MNDYACLVSGTLKEIRRLDAKPDDIQHKSIAWYPVVRETGANAFTGVENGNYVIRTVDPATLPPAVPQSITPRQCRLVLLQQNLLDTVETMIAQQDRETQITWDKALEFRRNDPLLAALAASLGLTSDQIDQFFIAAAQL